jgi:hypothetical protein
MRNVIAFNWVLWFLAAALGTLSVAVELFRKQELAVTLIAKIDIAGRDPGAVLFASVFGTLVCALVLGTNIAYVQYPSLYKTDFSFLLIGFLFYFLLTIYLLCIALSISLSRATRSDSGS